MHVQYLRLCGVDCIFLSCLLTLVKCLHSSRIHLIAYLNRLSFLSQMLLLVFTSYHSFNLRFVVNASDERVSWEG